MNDLDPLDSGVTRAPKSQMLRTVEAIAHAKAIGKRVELTIDGKPIAVPVGTTILEAATTLGVRIPTLCYHEDLCLAGVCRICVVEIQGQRTLQAACSYPITAPIQALTHTAKVRRAGGTCSTCSSRRTTATAAPACETTIANSNRSPRSTASITTASATPRGRATRSTRPATPSCGTSTSASSAAAASAPASTSRRSACWRRSAAATARASPHSWRSRWRT